MATARIEVLKPQAEQRIPALVTLQELAKLWALPVSWLFHHTRAGVADPLPIVRLGRYCRVDLGDPKLAAWLNRRRVGK
ncbi:MAG: hypothetical protein WA252_01725 [Candidatus Sulfotelmatobacter sp.]